MGIQLKVFGARGEENIIDLCDNEEQLKKITVLQLREKIRKELNIDYDFRIIFRTQVLEDDKLLLSYGIQTWDAVIVRERLRGGGSPGDGTGRMGDKEGKNRSMERLFLL